MQMDLKTFVEDSLVQICEGIKAAQERTADTGAYIAPFLNGDGKISVCKVGDATPQKVSFNVAVVVTEESGKGTGVKGGLTISIAKSSLSLGGDASDNDKRQDSNTTTISFDVPVLWPIKNATEEDLGEPPVPFL